MEKLPSINANLLDSIIGLIDTTRQNVAKTVNQELTLLYWNIGKSINEDILNNARADYGKKVILGLSIELTKIYGSGFSKRNLYSFVKLNGVLQDVQIVQTVSAQLSWSHLYNMTIRYLCHYLKTPIFELENQINSK